MNERALCLLLRIGFHKTAKEIENLLQEVFATTNFRIFAIFFSNHENLISGEKEVFFLLEETSDQHVFPVHENLVFGVEFLIPKGFL